MAILWAGGEDIDFPISAAMGITTTAGRFRAGWARCAITSQQNGNVPTNSLPFSGGAVTSAWLSYYFSPAVTAASSGGSNYTGFGLSGTNKGLLLGSDATGGKLVLVKYDGTTRTVLATEGGISLVAPVNIRIDMQVTNYGATATVNVYVNGSAVISFSGDVTVSGMTNFDSVTIFGSLVNAVVPAVSEIFVMDSDTRAVQGMQTLALTGAGTTNNWTNNTYTNINAIAATDNTPTYVNTTAQDQEYNVTDPTPTAFSVTGVVISARMAKSAAATPTQVKLGYNSGGSVGFGTGAAKTVTTGWQHYQQIDALNPVTGVAFTSAELTALQLDLQSA